MEIALIYGTKFRGTKLHGMRPNLIMVDDPMLADIEGTI